MPGDLNDARPCDHERTSSSGRYCIDCLEELVPGTKRLAKIDRWNVEDKVVDSESK